MKFILVIGELGPNENFVTTLKDKGYICLATTNTDEVDQVGKQNGRIVFFFSNPNFAYQFLKANKWEGFEYSSILFTQKKPIVTPDIQKKLDGVGLKLFYPGTADQMFERLESFYEKGNAGLDDAEIEFSVHQDLEKKA